MVQVVVDGRDLKSVRQFDNLFDVVEPVVVLDDEAVLDAFRQVLEVLGEAIQCRFFIAVDSTDMQNDFIRHVGAECGQDFVVVDQIGDGALHDVLDRGGQDGVLARVQGNAHAAFMDLGGDAFEGLLVDFRPIECVDRTRTERDQVRTDAEKFDVVLAVIVDHPL